MEISVTNAKAQLTELIRRAEAGEEVVLTRHGQPIARIAPVAASKKRGDLGALIAEIQASAKRHLKPGPSAARSQDFLYGEDGLPK